MEAEAVRGAAGKGIRRSRARSPPAPLAVRGHGPAPRVGFQWLGWAGLKASAPALQTETVSHASGPGNFPCARPGRCQPRTCRRRGAKRAGGLGRRVRSPRGRGSLGRVSVSALRALPEAAGRPDRRPGRRGLVCEMEPHWRGESSKQPGSGERPGPFRSPPRGPAGQPAAGRFLI